MDGGEEANGTSLTHEAVEGHDLVDRSVRSDLSELQWMTYNNLH